MNLKNIRTDRASKKLDAKQANHTTINVIESHSYPLDTPTSIYHEFYSDLLHLVSFDPLDSKSVDDAHPIPVVVEEWEIEKIQAERKGDRGKQYLVKRVGYGRPSWEPSSTMAETAALDAYETCRKESGGKVMG